MKNCETPSSDAINWRGQQKTRANFGDGDCRTYREIGEILGISFATVDRTMHIIMFRLANRLNEELQLGRTEEQLKKVSRSVTFHVMVRDLYREIEDYDAKSKV
jgi:hypothetical protein